MSKNAIYIAAAAVLFLAWRGVGAKDTTGHAAAMPSDPYGCQMDQWDVLNSTCPNAHPSSNDIIGRTGFGGVGMCPDEAMCYANS